MATIGSGASPLIGTPTLPFNGGSGSTLASAQGQGQGQGSTLGQGQPSIGTGSPSKQPTPMPTQASVTNLAPMASAVPARNANANTDRPIDMRAEEDAARRYNVGRVFGNTRFGAGPRGKRTDLFGPELKAKLDRMDHQVSFDEESLAYLSMAAETRLRDILSSSISAQQHRTTSSFLHPPPTSNPKTNGAGNGKDRPMWAVSINSDPNALLEAMNKSAKEAERDFRTARMDRLAREHELERIRERASGGDGSGVNMSTDMVRAGSESGSALGPGQGSNGNGNGNNINSESSGIGNAEAEDQSAAGSSPPAAPSPSGSGGVSTPKSKSSAPVFGAVQPRKPGSTSTTKKKNPKDVSSDVQIKMSNMTAMRSAGTGKKYSWLNSAPSISSPLSGRKKGKKAGGAEGEGEGDAGGDGMLSAANGNNGKKRKKSRLAMDDGNGNGAEAGEGGAEGGGSKRQKRRKMPTLPSRRMVSVPTTLDGRPDEREKLVPDDRALTLPDVVFAMERDGAGKGMGMGSGDEVLRRAMARPGGIGGLSRPR